MLNKYQISLYRLFQSCSRYIYANGITIGSSYDDYKILKELVDKATPKNPVLSEDYHNEDQTDIYDENGHIYPYMCVCPNCKKPTIYDFEYNVKFDYCRDCGQRILWEE